MKGKSLSNFWVKKIHRKINFEGKREVERERERGGGESMRGRPNRFDHWQMQVLCSRERGGQGERRGNTK